VTAVTGNVAARLTRSLGVAIFQFRRDLARGNVNVSIVYSHDIDMTAGQTNASMVWGTTFGVNKQSHILRFKYDIMFRSASFWSRVGTSRNIAVTFSTIFTKSGDTTFPVSDVLLI
jgi:hypothetical protein